MNRRLVIAVIAFVLAAVVVVLGPYSDVRALLRPRPPFEEQPIRATEAARVLTELGPSGREIYRRQLRWDLLVIAANATWLAIWLSSVARRTLSRRAGLVLTVCGADAPAFADLIENLSISRLMAAPSAPRELWITLAHGATTTKGAAFMLALAAAITLSFTLGARSWRRRARSRA